MIGAMCPSGWSADNASNTPQVQLSTADSYVRLTLFDNESDDRQALAYLLLDDEGNPSLYPITQGTTHAGSLANIASSALNSQLKTDPSQIDVRRCDLVGWRNG